MKRAALTLALSLASPLVSASVYAQLLIDPMKPPSGYLTRDAAPQAPASTPLVLQSTKISGSERTAIINGETVKQGDKVGSAIVVKIADGEVTLKEGDSEQVLKLYPEIDKRMADKQARSGARDARSTPAPSARSGKASGGGTP